jgi:hypothetical protein
MKNAFYILALSFVLSSCVKDNKQPDTNNNPTSLEKNLWLWYLKQSKGNLERTGNVYHHVR